MEIVEMRAPDALLSLREEWEDLLTRCARATIYQTWEWNEAWWRAFGRRKRLRLLLAREQGALVGLAPLYVSHHLGTPLRRLAFLGTGCSDYLDILAPEERGAAVSAALLRFLEASDIYDMADFQQLRPTALLRTEVERLLNTHPILTQPLTPNASHLRLSPQEPCPFISLPASWEEYTARLGKKMCSNLSYYDRLLPRTFETVETRLTSPDELPAAMTALFDLHQKRWNARLLPGVLGGRRMQAFHRLVAERFQARGWLRLHQLRIDERIVSALYCFRFRERYYYYLGGFDPALGRYSPGTVLTAHAIRQAIAEGCEEFDFLRGAEPYKYRWTPEERMNHRLLIARPQSLRSRALLQLNRLEHYVERRAKVFAEQWGREKQP